MQTYSLLQPSALERLSQTPSFEGTYELAREMLREADLRGEALRAEQRQSGERYQTSVDTLFSQARERYRCAEMMTRALSKFAHADTEAGFVGTDYSEDASVLFKEGGTEVLRRVRSQVYQRIGADAPPLTPEQFADLVQECGEVIEVDPGRLGTLQADLPPEVELMVAKYTLRVNLSAYLIAEYCAVNGGSLPFSTDTDITPWVARQLVVPLERIVEDVQLESLGVEPAADWPRLATAFLDSVLAQDLFLRFTTLKCLFPGEEDRARTDWNQADHALEQQLMSIWDFQNVISPEVSSAELPEVCAWRRSLLEFPYIGLEGVRPTQFDSFFVHVCHARSICKLVKEETRLKLDEARTELRLAASAVSQELDALTPYRLKPIEELRNRRPPWEPGDGPCSPAEVQSWVERVARDFKSLRLIPTEDGRASWATSVVES